MSPVKKENIIAAYPQATLERLENLIDFFILFFKVVTQLSWYFMQVSLRDKPK